MANQPVCVHSLQVSKILFYYAGVFFYYFPIRMTNCSYFCSYHSWTEHLFLASECFALIISDFSDKSIVLAQIWVYQNVILV